MSTQLSGSDVSVITVAVLDTVPPCTALCASSHLLAASEAATMYERVCVRVALACSRTAYSRARVCDCVARPIFSFNETSLTCTAASNLPTCPEFEPSALVNLTHVSSLTSLATVRCCFLRKDASLVTLRV